MKRSADELRELAYNVALSSARSNVSMSDTDPRWSTAMHHAISSAVESMGSEREVSDYPELRGEPLTSAQQTWMINFLDRHVGFRRPRRR